MTYAGIIEILLKTYINLSFFIQMISPWVGVMNFTISCLCTQQMFNTKIG